MPYQQYNFKPQTFDAQKKRPDLRLLYISHSSYDKTWPSVLQAEKKEIFSACLRYDFLIYHRYCQENILEKFSMKPKRLTIFLPRHHKRIILWFFFYRRNFVCSVNVQTAMMP